jgi:anti-sigma regulatory factor (Ser/Thr protein kinase)
MGTPWPLASEFPFHCDPACVGEARRWLEACLRREFATRPAAKIIPDALVIASELVTNAVNAKCVTGRLHWRLSPDRLQVSVYDDGPGWPVLRDPGPLDPHGRGLHIVQALAADAGVRQVRGGKEAWAMLALPSE